MNTESFKTPVYRQPTKDEVQRANCAEMQAYHRSWIKGEAAFCTFCNGWQELDWAMRCKLYKPQES